MNKYHSMRTWSNLCQRWFDSKAEAARAEELHLLQQAGGIKDLEYQVVFALNVKPKVSIKIDFAYTDNGERIHEDTKGVLTRDFRTKLAWLKQQQGISVRLQRQGEFLKRMPIKAKSDKQRAKDRHWKETTDIKANALGFKCQWCGGLGVRIWNENPWEYLSGHHILPRRFNIHTYDNCYICHELPCHNLIENNNVDVRVYPNKNAWETRTNEMEGAKCQPNK